ncbi:sigma E protease regulator RseP [Vibrio sp. ZSDZ34]|jgi:regulator of sigma E protease|uniref:Zinc metalloprotease n=1 Tax=Vibrio gelatinilyticus TaxID=2893468 RepID=A0A9X1WE16_9VIBR|nr:sigma E protease regulator RseP [Vibrio gelatinilyticus]MCJ2377720.1 sigma E protease regulator RseP [Vibrio gelatinilyticus]
MIDILWNFASFIVALGILVAVHEYGHFWVARKCGVHVEKFSIGFGRSIWSRVGQDGTEYSVSMIPLGGYVKMLDSRVDDVAEQDMRYTFDKKSLWKRTAIVGAGPAFNFLFAIVAYWLVFLIGIPAVKPVVGEIAPQSIAAEAGLQEGMQITSIAGQSTLDWDSVNLGFVKHIGESQMEVTVSSEEQIGTDKKLTFDLQNWNFDPELESPMVALGFKPYTPEIKTILDTIADDGAGAAAGLMAGDRIVQINDQEITQWQQVVDVIQVHPEQPITIMVERSGQSLTIVMTPNARQLKNGTTIGFAGIAPQISEWPESYRFELQYGVFESVGKAIDKTGQIISLTISMLKKLIVGDVGLNNLSGPISIAKGAGATADYGLVYFLGFLALISVNLGIINLVPLPMLDGGHLLFFAIEAVIRRPVPEKVQEMGYRIGGAIIFSLMLIAIFNDFTRL